MPGYETHLDASGFYYTALDTLLESLHISSTPNLEPTRCSNIFRNRFHTVDEAKFFSIYSASRPLPKSENHHTNHALPNAPQTDDAPQTPTHNARDTPRRVVATARKQKLFQSSESDQEDEERVSNTRTRLTRCTKNLTPQKLFHSSESVQDEEQKNAKPEEHTKQQQQQQEEAFQLKSRSSKNARHLSPQSMLLKKAITRFECLQRRQERMALNKKPARTSLRV